MRTSGKDPLDRAALCPRFAHRILSSRFPRNSKAPKSNCASSFSTIFRSTTTSETAAHASGRRASPRRRFASDPPVPLLEVAGMSSPARLAVILGPTASGKSALAIALAEKLNGEVVVCDSTQVYRRFDIGTAKVPTADQKGIPHWMMDLVEPHEIFTAGDYRRRAEEILRDIHRARALADSHRRHRPLSPRATRRARRRAHALRRIARPSARAIRRPRPRISPSPAAPPRSQFRRAHRAARHAKNNPRHRNARAHKKSVNEIHAAGRAPLEGFTPIKIGLKPPRPALYARIEQRVDRNARSRLAGRNPQNPKRGVSSDAKPFTFIGYREMLAQAPVGEGLQPSSRRLRQHPPSTKSANPRATSPNASKPGSPAKPTSTGYQTFGDDPAALQRSLQILAQAQSATP